MPAGKISARTTVVALIALAALVLGWVASAAYHRSVMISGADSFAAAWITQVQTLTREDGRVQDAEEVAQTVRIILENLTLGLGLNYHRFSDEEAARVERYAARALGQLPEDSSSRELVECMLPDEEGAAQPPVAQCMRETILAGVREE